jgi:hypothetical protein
MITRVFYVPDRDVLAAKRRRGRPTDHLRRHLNDVLIEGGRVRREIADLIEDRVGAKIERLRGRRRRAKAAARPRSTPSPTIRKSKGTRP